MTQPAFTLTPCPECTAGKHGNCDGTTWDEIADAPATCPCLTSGHGEPAPTQSDDGITYVDHEPSLSMMASYGVPAWVTEQRHVHLRGSDRCLKRDGGELCPGADSVPGLRERVEFWEDAHANSLAAWRDALATIARVEALYAKPRVRDVSSAGPARDALVEDIEWATGRNVMADQLHRDQASWRDAGDDDEERITRRVHAAINSGQRDAVVAVVLQETAQAGDDRKAVERALDLAGVWETAEPDGIMSRRRAAAVLREVLDQ